MIAQARVVAGGRGFRCGARRPRWRPGWRTPRRGGPTHAARPATALGLGGRPVERRKHGVKGRGGRLAGALAGGGDGPLADGLRVVGGHAEPVATEGFVQRRPGGAKLLRGGVDAAELFGEGEGAFCFGAVGEEAAGLPAHPPLGQGSSQWAKAALRASWWTSNCLAASATRPGRRDGGSARPAPGPADRPLAQGSFLLIGHLLDPERHCDESALRVCRRGGRPS